MRTWHDNNQISYTAVTHLAREMLKFEYTTHPRGTVEVTSHGYANELLTWGNLRPSAESLASNKRKMHGPDKEMRSDFFARRIPLHLALVDV